MVVIDDIDRLEQREIRGLFRFLRINSDLPNLTYLLLFQSNVVERALNDKEEFEGRRYLEKIVDLRFDVPQLRIADLDQVLFDGLNAILGDLKGAVKFDESRWAEIYLGGLQSFVRNVRSVRRLLSALAVQAQAHQGAGAFEVNQIDLIALEVLRLESPRLFQAIAHSKETLLSDPTTAERNESIERLIQLAGHDAKPASKILLGLFPKISKHLNEPHAFEDSETNHVSRPLKNPFLVAVVA